MTKHLAGDPMAAEAEVVSRQPVARETSREAPPASGAEGEAIQIRSGASMEELEEAYITLVLQRTNNNKTQAAEILGISVRTLHNKLGLMAGREKAKGAANS
jgi:DNA-binding NtrC family response regulator